MFLPADNAAAMKIHQNSCFINIFGFLNKRAEYSTIYIATFLNVNLHIIFVEGFFFGRSLYRGCGIRLYMVAFDF